MALAAGTRKSAPKSDQAIASHLVGWYDLHHRDLPWRVSPAELAAGRRPDPYRVWLSEIMLQQTTVEAVKPYFRKFVAAWPDVAALAAADTDTIMSAWAGLGYYSRARNLKACAEMVAAMPDGFPGTEDELRKLPGVGAYTAAAIAAIAFNRPAAVVDGNVERVMARLFALETPLPDLKRDVRDTLGPLVPAARPGDFAQAMMDLGATICTPKRPRCMLCPLRADCLALSTDDPERLPLRRPKPDKPQRRGAAFVAVRSDGAILVRKRPDKGLLGGMTEVPTTAWTARLDGVATVDGAPFPADWRRTGAIAHVFTHFSVGLEVYRADADDVSAPVGCRWSTEIAGEALPTIMKKVIESAIPGVTKPVPAAKGSV